MDGSAELDAGDQVAVVRLADVPCCYCESTGCCVLLERGADRRGEFERLRCLVTGRSFRRVWFCEQADMHENA